MMEEIQADESIEQYLHEALISCEKCHLCNTVCPVLGTRVSQGPFGINRAIYYGLKWNRFDQKLRDLVYSCTTCGKCVSMCSNVSRALPLVEIFEKARELLLVDKMLGPMPDQVSVLKNMHVRGNPWGYPPHERTHWADGLNITFASKEKSVDVLYFVGCACSYDPRAQKIAKDFSSILEKAGINFGILEKETCSGHEARRMGETGLFQVLSEANTAMFNEAGIRHIVTTDPHDFYSFTQDYADQKDSPKVQHSTQFINDLIDEGKLKLVAKVDKKVTYHDPCYLGRRSKVLEEPRKLLGRIPGINFVEMENSGVDSDCCGMGGGRMWMEPPRTLVSSQSIAQKRVQQALHTGAEILVTACPFCNITLKDAVNALEKEDVLEVMDITTLASQSL